MSRYEQFAREAGREIRYWKMIRNKKAPGTAMPKEPKVEPEAEERKPKFSAI